VKAEQAAQIAETMETIAAAEIAPTEGDPSTKVAAEIQVEAEECLIGLAAQFEPRSLGALGERIIFHVAPEVGDRADAAALKRQQASARAVRRLHLSPCAG